MLASAAQNGYTIDQYHPDQEDFDPEGHRDEVSGAAFFKRPRAALSRARRVVPRPVPMQRAEYLDAAAPERTRTRARREIPGPPSSPWRT